MRKHLTYANVMVTLLAIGALTGGVAYAANTIGSTDIINGQVKSVDIGTGQVQAIDVRNEGLTGAEVADQSGVDSCTHGSVRLGELCFRAMNSPQSFFSALAVCASAGLRVPTYSEATALATYDLPDIDDTEMFWTTNYWTDEGSARSLGVDDGGSTLSSATSSTYETVCVTTPTN
jgi:hypothetical protein